VKITEVKTRPLRIPYREPFHWAQGVVDAAEVVLVEVYSDEGAIGYGESMGSSSPVCVERLIQEAGRGCIGRSPFESTALITAAYQRLFAARGSCSAPRFGALVLAGLDMALWDLAGKAAGCAVSELLGGPVRDAVHYFGFPQGDLPEEIARGARFWSEQGSDVIYVKIGRGDEVDQAIVEQVRAAIGTRRLRIDANEAWDILQTRRMAQRLARFDVEFLEQPTPSASIAALKQVRDSSAIPIAADQLVFTPEEVYEVCRHQAADLIVLGIHETGSIDRFRRAAAIASAAGMNVCIHGLYETGVTTCAMNQIGATLANLDDGNQYMRHFLSEDIIGKPDLSLTRGSLGVSRAPGLGFELDWNAVGRAEDCYRRAAANCG
jgi:L-alanine-DL-glutamate epimerase-like enolase superfamily enzyme